MLSWLVIRARCWFLRRECPIHAAGTTWLGHPHRMDWYRRCCSDGSSLARPGLAARDGPVADGVDTGADLVRGRLRQRRTAASPAQVGMDDPVRLAGAVAPGPDQAVELLPQRGQGLAAHRGRGGRCLRGL